MEAYYCSAFFCFIWRFISVNENLVMAALVALVIIGVVAMSVLLAVIIIVFNYMRIERGALEQRSEDTRNVTK